MKECNIHRTNPNMEFPTWHTDFSMYYVGNPKYYAGKAEGLAAETMYDREREPTDVD